MNLSAFFLIMSVSISKFSFQQITINFMGDIMIGRRHLTSTHSQLNQAGISSIFQDVSQIFLEADFNVANLETPLTKECDINSHKAFGFFTNPDFLAEFEKINLNIFSIANNHILDCKILGMNETLETLDRYNFTYFGAGHSQSQAKKPRIIEKYGITIGLLGYSNISPLKYPSTDPQGFVNRLSIKNLKQQIQDLRPQVDIIVVNVHSGIEYSNYPSNSKMKSLRSAIDFGADLVIAHHPHVLNGIETYKGKYIVYSLGNFVFDQAKLQTMKSMIFQCKIYKNSVDDVKLIPIIISQFAPKRATGKLAKLILKDIATYSKIFNQSIQFNEEYGYLVEQVKKEKITKNIQMDIKKEDFDQKYYSSLIKIMPEYSLNSLRLPNDTQARIGINILIYGDLEVVQQFKLMKYNNSQLIDIQDKKYITIKPNGSIQNINALDIQKKLNYSLMITISLQEQDEPEIKVKFNYYINRHRGQNSKSEFYKSVSQSYKLEKNSKKLQIDFNPLSKILYFDIINISNQIIRIEDIKIIYWQQNQQGNLKSYQTPNNYQFIQIISTGPTVSLQYSLSININ